MCDDDYEAGYDSAWRDAIEGIATALAQMIRQGLIRQGPQTESDRKNMVDTVIKVIRKEVRKP